MRAMQCVVAGLLMALTGPGTASAQPFPARPITIVVPLAAGGPTDTLARILAEGMSAALGQPVVIQNVVGASATIGVGKVVHAAPDGYTLSIGNWFTHVLNGAIHPLQYHVLTDFQPIALLADNPLLIVGRKTLPADDLKGLVEWLRANPDKATEGTSGIGSASHVSGLFFQRETSVRFQFIPYRGAAPAMQDLVAGRIDLMFDQVSNALPHIRADKIKAFAVTASSRAAAAPEIPTVDEAGLPNFHISIWHALWAPKGTPKDVIAKLNAAVASALASAPIRNRLATLGQDIRPPDQQTPEVLASFHEAEIVKWWPIVRAAGIKAE